MPIGVIVNSLSIVFGGIIGGILGQRMTEEFKQQMNMIFGVCALTMGISGLGLMTYMPAVIFSVVVGTGIGLMIHFGQWVEKAAAGIQKIFSKIIPMRQNSMDEQEFMRQFITVIVLFCASGTGIYGSLESGMTGDASVLLAKSILDFFTALIFATQLGLIISTIAIPQFLIFLTLFFAAGLIVPLITPEMINDFRACGGIIMLATGFRMLKLNLFPTADMILSMVLVMPMSWVWAQWILPLIG